MLPSHRHRTSAQARPIRHVTQRAPADVPAATMASPASMRRVKRRTGLLCSMLVITSPAVSLAKMASIAARCGSDRHSPRSVRHRIQRRLPGTVI
jgi:hypothetical protein